MIIRCIIKKTDKGYVGECLELSLAARADTPLGCKEKLEQSIEDYIETLNIVYHEDKNVTIRPVAFYPIRKLLFDINYYLCKKTNKDNCNLERIESREIPVGV